MEKCFVSAITAYFMNIITISQISSAKKEDEEKTNTDDVKNENGPEVKVAAESEADKANC